MFFRAALTSGAELIFLPEMFVRCERKSKTFTLVLAEGRGGPTRFYQITEQSYNELFRDKNSPFVCWE